MPRFSIKKLDEMVDAALPDPRSNLPWIPLDQIEFTEQSTEPSKAEDQVVAEYWATALQDQQANPAGIDALEMAASIAGLVERFGTAYPLALLEGALCSRVNKHNAERVIQTLLNAYKTSPAALRASWAGFIIGCSGINELTDAWHALSEPTKQQVSSLLRKW